MSDPTSRIWLTYKTRIFSERRYETYAVISHLSLSWYAFLSIVFSIYQANFARTMSLEGANQAALVISVLTFALSLVIYGFKFDDMARTHRDCYLNMQSIWQSNLSDCEKLEKYRLILDRYPNHADRDYRRLRFETWRDGGYLTDTNGNRIPFSRLDIAMYLIARLVWMMFLFLVFAGPIALGAAWAQ